MIEFVMIIALLGAILAGIFFFGWSMGNQQNIRIAARYQCWKQVKSGTRMGFDNLNAEFFQNRAIDNSESAWRIVTGPRDEFISSINDARAQNVANDELLDGYFAGISSIGLETNIPYEGGIYSHLEGAMFSGHVRDGAEWYLGQADNLQPLRDEFYNDVDAIMETLPNELGDYLRDLYLQRWSRASAADY